MHSFFFLAEGGIRAGHVTGVQTCALPIWSAPGSVEAVRAGRRAVRPTAAGWRGRSQRSEERRVGKESRVGRARDAIKKDNEKKGEVVSEVIRRAEKQRRRPDVSYLLAEDK